MVEVQPRDFLLPRMTVITLPTEIDATNAHRVRVDLQAAFAPGVTTVVADMTATAFCDSRGIRALVLAAERGAACGAELRVVPSAWVLRILAMLGADSWLAISPSLDEALATGPRG